MDASRGGTFVLFNGNVTGKFQELVSKHANKLGLANALLSSIYLELDFVRKVTTSCEILYSLFQAFR